MILVCEEETTKKKTNKQVRASGSQQQPQQQQSAAAACAEYAVLSLGRFLATNLQTNDVSQQQQRKQQLHWRTKHLSMLIPAALNAIHLRKGVMMMMRYRGKSKKNNEDLQ